jgi:hypothetical protein
MANDKDLGEFDIDQDDTPQARDRSITTALAAAPSLPAPPLLSGGAAAEFYFGEGVRVRITMPGATGVSGWTDGAIEHAWWSLRSGPHVLNEGPLLDMLRKGAAASKQ